MNSQNNMEANNLINQDPKNQVNESVSFKKKKQVKFVEYKNKTAKREFVNSNTRDFDQLKNKLELNKEASLILSIVGSNINFPISIKIKNVFKEGLIDILESNKNTIIITGITFLNIKHQYY